LRIPKGFAAYRTRSPAPSHGIVIALDSATNRISIDGNYNAAEYANPIVAHAPTVAYIRSKSATPVSPSYRDTTLGGLPAVELAMDYLDKQTSVPRICRSTLAIRRQLPAGSMEIVYQITLDTTVDRASADVPAYEDLRGSFRLERTH
jgi:hypothetical protein